MLIPDTIFSIVTCEDKSSSGCNRSVAIEHMIMKDLTFSTNSEDNLCNGIIHGHSWSIDELTTKDLIVRIKSFMRRQRWKFKKLERDELVTLCKLLIKITIPFSIGGKCEESESDESSMCEELGDGE